MESTYKRALMGVYGAHKPRNLDIRKDINLAVTCLLIV
jgi:hypothetical protein